MGQQGPDFVFQSVDGGLVNNNPFDYAQYALYDGPAGGPVGGQTVDRAIVMVAPFPEPPELQPEGSPSPAVIGILKNLFPSLINQARFRTADLAPALTSGFQSLSDRPVTPHSLAWTTAASKRWLPFEFIRGLLGGFGGFLDEIQAHDFQLGRRNCQQFLRTSFSFRRTMLSSAVLNQKRCRRSSAARRCRRSGPAALWPKMTQSDFKAL